jgi:hypothetical protein
MRIYSIIRHGARVTYKEMSNKCALPVHATTICIPSATPTVLDPFLLWKQTSDRTGLKKMSIHDKNDNEWFTIKSSVSISKVLEISSDIAKEMK